MKSEGLKKKGKGLNRKETPARHSRKLLTPGWAGEVTDAEAQYIARKLIARRELRQAWGVRQIFGRRWDQITVDMVRKLVTAWATNPDWDTWRPVAAAPGKKKAPVRGANGQLCLPLDYPGAKARSSRRPKGKPQS